VTHSPSTPAQCVGLLQSVLSCLDKMAEERSDGESAGLALAAVHVQEAIELIRSETTEP
jgi:hypothetical protein